MQFKTKNIKYKSKIEKKNQSDLSFVLSYLSIMKEEVQMNSVRVIYQLRSELFPAHSASRLASLFSMKSSGNGCGWLDEC